MTLYRWDDLERERMMEGIERRFIHGEKGMVAQVFLKQGAVVATHTHEAEQLTFIIEGHLRLWLGDDERQFDVHAGEVLIIPSNVPHRALAVEDTYDLDIFAPPRQDWIAGTDSYLRGR